MNLCHFRKYGTPLPPPYTPSLIELILHFFFLQMVMCALRCGENTENEFGIPVFVGKTVYIYTKTSPFIEIWKKIFLPMRKWLRKFCQPSLGAKIQSSRNYMLCVL